MADCALPPTQGSTKQGIERGNQTAARGFTMRRLLSEGIVRTIPKLKTLCICGEPDARVLRKRHRVKTKSRITGVKQRQGETMH